jgi:anti-sigma regulatory factor (Ser/Thr protein kinase)
MPRTLTQQSYLELGAHPSAVPCARLHARNVLYEWGVRPIADTVELIVSELITNAVSAASGYQTAPYVRLRLRMGTDHVLVQVWDGNPQLPQQQPHDLDAESGRGLEIVAALSARWGAAPQPFGGKIVWAMVRY